MLFDYAPSFYENSTVLKMLFSSIDSEIDLSDKSLDDLKANLFIETATWGLDYFEKMLGITTNTNLRSFEERRSAILARIRGVGTCTVSMIQNVAQAFTNGTVTVTENFSDYSFTLVFRSGKLPSNIEALYDDIEEIKPAHLDFNIKALDYYEYLGFCSAFLINNYKKEVIYIE